MIIIEIKVINISNHIVGAIWGIKRHISNFGLTSQCYWFN